MRAIHGTKHDTYKNVICKARNSADFSLYDSGIQNVFELVSRLWRFVIGECCLHQSWMLLIDRVLKIDFLSEGKNVMKLSHYDLLTFG